LTGAKLKFSDSATKKLEKKIDRIEGMLPVQKNFLIYGGTRKARELYFARALARRAERKLVTLKSKPEILAYINRLSDYLFILARKENRSRNLEEKYWRG
jgi:cob(I)alamin adenosyltransferase